MTLSPEGGHKAPKNPVVSGSSARQADRKADRIAEGNKRPR